jgi:hypothetical protein
MADGLWRYVVGVWPVHRRTALVKAAGEVNPTRPAMAVTVRVRDSHAQAHGIEFTRVPARFETYVAEQFAVPGGIGGGGTAKQYPVGGRLRPGELADHPVHKGEERIHGVGCRRALDGFVWEVAQL